MMMQWLKLWATALGQDLSPSDTLYDARAEVERLTAERDRIRASLNDALAKVDALRIENARMKAALENIRAYAADCSWGMWRQRIINMTKMR